MNMTMKKLFLSLSVLAVVLGFNACSTDVDLYADFALVIVHIREFVGVASTGPSRAATRTISMPPKWP